MTDYRKPEEKSSTRLLGEDLTVTRVGYGAMGLTGPGVWGHVADRDSAVSVLRHAVDLGINFIDTADSYGPFTSEQLIMEALYPYRDVVVATKGGLVRTGPDQWHPMGHPTYLRQCVEMSLRRLRVERIELYQLHRIDPEVPLADQLGELNAMRVEGKIAKIGLSQVSLPQLVEARLIAPIASVQNRFNLADRRSQDVLEYCTREGLAFISWSPLGAGTLPREPGGLAALAEQAGCTVGQLVLAWLLHVSPVMLAVPGTLSMRHLAENAGAAAIELTADHLNRLSSALANPS
jgi:pyridoxine 4-dehydrogenase